MLEKKIALLTSVTFNNIGNGFIDLGAEAALMKALPLNAELFKVSSNANFAATMGQMFMLKENPIINWLWVHTMQRAAKKLHDRSYKTVKTQNIFSMASMVKCDYFIIPGCVLTVPFFTIYGDLIKRKAEQGSMQLQGEVQELAIEEWLREKFPLDSIDEVKKGARGADCMQIVHTR